MGERERQAYLRGVREGLRAGRDLERYWHRYSDRYHNPGAGWPDAIARLLLWAKAGRTG